MVNISLTTMSKYSEVLIGFADKSRSRDAGAKRLWLLAKTMNLLKPVAIAGSVHLELQKRTLSDSGAWKDNSPFTGTSLWRMSGLPKAFVVACDPNAFSTKA